MSFHGRRLDSKNDRARTSSVEPCRSVKTRPVSTFWKTTSAGLKRWGSTA